MDEQKLAALIEEYDRGCIRYFIARRAELNNK
jgi:hypothetical protein